MVEVGTSTNITQISATVSPICRMGSLQVPMECRPQQWGAIDSGIINASLVMLGRACKSTKELLPVGSAVLIERGTCSFSTKAGIAKDAGAVAIIFFDPNDPLLNRTIVTTGTALDLPIVSIGRANGEQLTKSLRNPIKEPYPVSILFSSKWQLERSEDKWRRITALPDAPSEAFLFHGSILAQLRRHGQARAVLQKAIKAAEVEGAEGRENASKVFDDAFFDLSILEATWLNESIALWNDFVERRAPKEYLHKFNEIMNGTLSKKVQHQLLKQMARRIQGEFGIDLDWFPNWAEKSNFPFRTSDRYGDGLTDHYSHCKCLNSGSVMRLAPVDHFGESRISKGGCRLRVSVETWRFLSASYAVVGVNTLVQLNAMMISHGICLSVVNPPLYEGGWKHEDGLYLPHIEDFLRRLPLATDEEYCPDVVLRMYFPFDLEPFPCPRTKTIVFGTSEFGISSDRALKKAMEWADMDPSIVFMTPSQWSAEGFVRSGMNASQIWVVPHGIDPEVFKPPESSDARQKIRKRFGWADNDIIFLNVGMMSHNKGLREMLRAFNDLVKWNNRNQEAYLPAHKRRIRLVFKGPSHIPPHLDSRQIKRGDSNEQRQWFYNGKPLLDDDVASTDTIDVIANSSLSSKELADLMGAADIYLSAYKAEGFNLPVLEAMAVGIPVIVTKGGPTDDFTLSSFAKYAKSTRVPGSMASISDLGQDILGYELEADVADLFDHMREAVEDESWRLNAGALASAHAHEFYTWRKVVESMVDDGRFSGLS